MELVEKKDMHIFVFGFQLENVAKLTLFKCRLFIQQ